MFINCWMFYGACYFSLLLRCLFGKCLCYLNRSSKYKVCVGVCLCPGPNVFPSVLLCFLCRTCQAIKPSCAAWSARSFCCCYLRSNPALWPHHRQHTTTTTSPPPASSPFHRHQNVATGTLALIQIFHGHLPPERRRLEEKRFKKFLPKGGGRNVSVISLERESWM